MGMFRGWYIIYVIQMNLIWYTINVGDFYDMYDIQNCIFMQEIQVAQTESLQLS